MMHLIGNLIIMIVGGALFGALGMNTLYSGKEYKFVAFIMFGLLWVGICLRFLF